MENKESNNNFDVLETYNNMLKKYNEELVSYINRCKLPTYENKLFNTYNNILKNYNSIILKTYQDTFVNSRSYFDKLTGYKTVFNLHNESPKYGSYIKKINEYTSSFVDKKEEVYSVRDATRELAYRYENILSPIRDLDIHLDSQQTSNNHLLKMLITILEDDTLPEDKISKWIGYIQGVMVMKGYITIDEERNFSRPLFHKVYEDNSVEIPETKESEDKIKIQLCYNAYDKNNYISEYRSPIFYANDANILFLNFITSILESGLRQGCYSKNKAILYIKDNWDIFENIMKDFSKDYNLYTEYDTDVMDIFDSEILEMLIEYFQCNDYVPQEFYDYDSANDKNPDGFLNGMGVYAYERVE